MYPSPDSHREALKQLSELFNVGVARANLDVSSTLGEPTTARLFLVVDDLEPMMKWIRENYGKFSSYDIGATFPNMGTVNLSIRDTPFLYQLNRIFRL